mgnify:CR=1 FL=1
MEIKEKPALSLCQVDVKAQLYGLTVSTKRYGYLVVPVVLVRSLLVRNARLRFGFSPRVVLNSTQCDSRE